MYPDRQKINVFKQKNIPEGGVFLIGDSQMQISLKKVRKFLSENVASRIILNISYTSIQLLWIHYHAVMESSK